MRWSARRRKRLLPQETQDDTEDKEDGGEEEQEVGRVLRIALLATSAAGLWFGVIRAGALLGSLGIS